MSERRACRTAFNRAIRRGDLVRPDQCEACGVVPGAARNGRALIDGHHHNGYDEEHWLDVQWLCNSCHQLVHPRRLGVPHTPEIRARIGASLNHYRAVLSDDERAALAAKQTEVNKRVWTGRHHTEETKDKIRKTLAKKHKCSCGLVMTTRALTHHVKATGHVS